MGLLGGPPHRVRSAFSIDGRQQPFFLQPLSQYGLADGKRLARGPGEVLSGSVCTSWLQVQVGTVNPSDTVPFRDGSSLQPPTPGFRIVSRWATFETRHVGLTGRERGTEKLEVPVHGLTGILRCPLRPSDPVQRVPAALGKLCSARFRDRTDLGCKAQE